MWQLLWVVRHSSSQLLWSQSSSSQRLTQMTAKFATDSAQQQVSLLNGFDFVWKKTFKKLRLSLLFMGLLVKLWDLSKSSPNRRLSEKVGVAKWFCKEFEFGEPGLFWVGNKVVNSCLGGRSSDKARKLQTVSLLLDDTLDTRARRNATSFRQTSTKAASDSLVKTFLFGDQNRIVDQTLVPNPVFIVNKLNQQTQLW